MDFGSSPPGARNDNVNKGQIMERLQTELAVASAQELLQRMTDKCFKKCVTKPGTSLDSSDQKCVAMCMDRYIDAVNLVTRAYTQRLQQEQSRM